MLIAYNFLQDLPNSTRTLLVMGMPVKFNSFMFGAKYPILLIRSLEISVLCCKSKYYKVGLRMIIKFCSSMTVLGNFYELINKYFQMSHLFTFIWRSVGNLADLSDSSVEIFVIVGA